MGYSRGTRQHGHHPFHCWRVVSALSDDTFLSEKYPFLPKAGKDTRLANDFRTFSRNDGFDNPGYSGFHGRSDGRKVPFFTFLNVLAETRLKPGGLLEGPQPR